MRVLLAIDGSPSSEAARRVVDAMAWPAATIIRVLGVVPPISPRVAAFGVPLPEPPEGDQESVFRATVHEATVALQRPGRRIERIVMTGRPASVIVDEAAAWGAELIVVGSRGLGRLGSMVLGSVSAEVVDHAPCPVLVTRSDAIRSILVAVDGSPSARQAVDHLALGYLKGRPAEVLAVGPTHPSEVQADAIAAQAAEDLAADGYRVRWSVSRGDAAHEIVAAASALDADLVVLGSRGLTGLARLRLGSVARNVLLHTHSSVLIVRGPVRVRHAERLEDGERIPAAAASH